MLVRRTLRMLLDSRDVFAMASLPSIYRLPSKPFFPQSHISNATQTPGVTQ